MYYEKQSLPELHYMKHLHDDDKDYVDYEKDILNKTLTPYLFSNGLMSGFLQRIQPLLSMMFDNFNIIRNFKNYTVDKYYYKHKH
jgi:hypothetical protein